MLRGRWQVKWYKPSRRQVTKFYFVTMSNHLHENPASVYNCQQLSPALAKIGGVPPYVAEDLFAGLKLLAN